MSLSYTSHTKISLKQHPTLNEAWLQDRIADDPAILQLGDAQVLAREKPLAGGGRLDMLLFDEESNCRYEVELMLGATDPSHIIRSIEYWDIERRKYPGYDHIAVLVAEDITTRFLNVISLLSGSVPLIAVQLDALQVEQHLLLNFVKVLDLTELRTDDAEESSGGGQVERAFWDKKAGPALMKICDGVLKKVNEHARIVQEYNYLRGYMGLRANGVVRNFIYVSPKPTKKYVHLAFRNPRSVEWVDRFESAGAKIQSKKKGRFRLTVNAADFHKHSELIGEAIADTIKEFDA